MKVTRLQLLILVLPVATFAILFFIIPVGFIGRISLHETATNLPYINGVTLKSYIRFFSDSYYLGILFQTLKLGIVVTVMSFLAGYLPAYLIALEPNNRRRNIYLLLVMIPMWTNMLVRIYGWMVILGRKGFINNTLMFLGVQSEPLDMVFNFPAVVITQCFAVSLPYVILTLSSVIQGIDKRYIEAAIGLKATRFRTFIEITLPLSLPGIVASSTIAFVWAIEAYAVPAFLGSPSEITMGMEAYQQMIGSQNWPFACVISIIIFAMTAAITLAVQQGSNAKRAH
jgi:putative spermidine/putrescine transport system permease protein